MGVYMPEKLDLTIIGAGMIVNDLILPAALQMRRDGIIGEITVTDMRWEALKSLENSGGHPKVPGLHNTR